MTTAASAIPQVIDALLVIANAAFPASSVVDVMDGPESSQEDTGQAFWIGSDGSEEITEGATANQFFPYTNTTFRRDDVTIHCTAQAWSGDDDFKTVRDQAFAQMQAFTAAVVADNTLGGAVNIGTWSVGSEVSLAQGFNSLGGVVAQVGFNVSTTVQFQG